MAHFPWLGHSFFDALATFLVLVKRAVESAQTTAHNITIDEVGSIVVRVDRLLKEGRRDVLSGPVRILQLRFNRGELLWAQSFVHSNRVKFSGFTVSGSRRKHFLASESSHAQSVLPNVELVPHAVAKEGLEQLVGEFVADWHQWHHIVALH